MTFSFFFLQINNYVDSLATKYEGFVTSISIGKSYEDRDMKLLRISKAGPGRPNIFIEAGKAY
jgi:hypothetical protein